MSGGGGGTTTTTVDPVYNAGMLELSKEQQAWASEMFNMFKYGVSYDPSEKQQGMYIDGKWVAATDLTPEQTGGEQWIDNPNFNKGHYETTTPTYGHGENQWQGEPVQTWVLDKDAANQPAKILNPNFKLESRTLGDVNKYNPAAHTSEMEYLQNVVESNQQLLGLQTQVNKADLESKLKLQPLATDIATKELQARGTAIGRRETLAKGIMSSMDINEGQRMNEAQAEVQHGFKNAQAANRINLSSFGLDPSSGMYASQNRSMALAEATGVAGARTGAKNLAEKEEFERKARGLQLIQ